jgi:hypothetical protein
LVLALTLAGVADLTWWDLRPTCLVLLALILALLLASIALLLALGLALLALFRRQVGIVVDVGVIGRKITRQSLIRLRIVGVLR